MQDNYETPKLHGWITPEYATQILIDILDYLEKVLPFDKYSKFINELNKITEYKAKVQRLATEIIDEYDEKCRSMTTNAQNVT